MFLYTPIQQCKSTGLRKFQTVELTFDTKSFTAHIQREQISYVFSTFYEEIGEVKKNGEMYFSYPVSRVSFALPFTARRVIFPENEIQFVIKE